MRKLLWLISKAYETYNVAFVSFNISMDLNNDLPGISTCTTCRFVEDKSNYWTAVLYFKHPNGSFIRVGFFRLK